MIVLEKNQIEEVSGANAILIFEAFLLAASIVELGKGFVDGMRDGLNGSTNGQNLACPASPGI